MAVADGSAHNDDSALTKAVLSSRHPFYALVYILSQRTIVIGCNNNIRLWIAPFGFPQDTAARLLCWVQGCV